MSPDEYIIKSGEELMQVDNPLVFMVRFYCKLYSVKVFKELYPGLGKLIKQFGAGVIYRSIVKNYYSKTYCNKESFYKDLLFTAIGIQKEDKLSEQEPTPITYLEYVKLRESVNV
jgi:hypothetical protein